MHKGALLVPYMVMPSMKYRVSCFGCLKGVSKSVQVLFNGIEAAMAMVLDLMILK